MKEQVKNNKIVLITLFIAIEIMLLVALDLGGGGIIFKAGAAIAAIVLSVYFWKELSVDLSEGLYIILLPVIFYGFILIIAGAYGSASDLFDSNYFDPMKETFMGLTLLERAINTLGLVGILLLGYFLRKTEAFTVKTVFLVIIAGLAVPVLISLIATLINYGFFHTIIHQGLVHFYGGQAYPIANQASMLVGFKLMTVDRNFLVTSALFIASTGFGLLFLNKEKERNEGIILAIISGVGLLTIILTGSFSSLIYLLPALIFVLIIKFRRKIKVNPKIALISLGALFGLGLLIFLLTAYNVFEIQSLWSSNSITRKLFMNGIIQRFYAIFINGFSLSNLYGNISKYASFNGVNIKVNPSGNVFFDSLWLDGIIGFLALGVFTLLLIYRLYKYFIDAEDSNLYKIILISLLLTVFIRYMLKYPFMPLIYEEDAILNFYPLINNPIFLITIFFTGYIFIGKKIKEESLHEKN